MLNTNVVDTWFILYYT